MGFITQNLSKVILGAFVVVSLFFVVRYLSNIKRFLMEVKTELSKVSWSTPQELLGATWVVITTTFILAIVIGFEDFVLSKFLRLIIK